MNIHFSYFCGYLSTCKLQCDINLSGMSMNNLLITCNFALISKQDCSEMKV